MSRSVLKVVFAYSFLVIIAAPQTTSQPKVPQTSKSKKRVNSNGRPCWKVIHLDREGMDRLDLHKHMSLLASTAGFTEEEVKEFPLVDVEQKAASAYGMAYLGWQHSQKDMKLDLVRSFEKRYAEARDIPPDQRAFVTAWIQKLEKVMMAAFDLGLADAKHDPCPF